MRGYGRHGRGSGKRHGRNLLRPSLLFLMHQGPAHGYDLTDRLKSFGIVDIDPSLVYRALRGMEEEGFIHSTWEEKQTQGPPRRVYSLTFEGDAYLKEYIKDLESTRSHIDYLLHEYEQHMQNETGKYHKEERRK